MIDHTKTGILAANDEYRRNPDKSWRAIVRNRCAICGGMYEPGELVSRANAPCFPGSALRHASCKVAH